MQLKRQAVKYIRDKAKSKYNKTGVCEICGSSDAVDFHHYNSVTGLFEAWCKAHSYSDDDVLAIRDKFIEEHQDEMYNQCVNLCHKHHEALHKLYGKKPSVSTASKQANWVEIQRKKHEDKRLDS